MKKSMLKELEKMNLEKKMPQEIRQKIIKRVYKNIVISIIIIIYFILLFLGSNGIQKTVRTVDFNIFSIILLLSSIVIFELSYKKDDGELALHGVEILVIAIITLFMPYMYFESTGLNKTLYMLIPSYIGVYYIFKTIVIAINENKKYRKENNEIKELIKKEDKKI